MSTFKRNLLQALFEEWQFFGFSSSDHITGTSDIQKKEYEDGMYQRVAAYWQLVGRRYGSQYSHLDGRDRGWPWSAAFISYCMDQAGAGDDFAYSSAHSTYINAALRAARDGDKKALYRARPIKGYELKTGDMVAYWRGSKKITFDNALNIGWYQSHCCLLYTSDAADD